MANPSTCPIRPICTAELCAWWTGQRCAIASIAESLAALASSRDFQDAMDIWRPAK